MDREVFAGNRVIANLMQQKQKKRLQQRIKYIKTNKSMYSEKALLKQKPKTNSLFFQKKLQIQKQNIALFHRIASIIKKTPKFDVQTISSLQKSRQTSMMWHRKIQSSLEQQNKIIQKRLSNQKPTINNKIFYRERANHEKYLKNMGKYPYILNKKIKTEADDNAFDQINLNDNNQQLPYLSKINSQSQQKIISKDSYDNQTSFRRGIEANKNSTKQLFKHKSLDFTVYIYYDLMTDMFTFSMQNNHCEQDKYCLDMPKSQFIEFFQESDYDYEKMITKLRLNKEGKVIYLQEKQNARLKSQKQEKDLIIFKPNSTGYTTSKSGFRSNKRRIIIKNQNIDRGSKSQRRIQNLQKKPFRTQKSQMYSEALAQNKFVRINLPDKKQ